MPELARQPGLRGAPVAEDRGLRYLEERCRLRHVEPAEEAALDHLCLTRRDLRQRVERRIESDHVIGGRQRAHGVIERDDRCAAASLVRATTPRGLHEYLTHRARGDALEVQ